MNLPHPLLIIANPKAGKGSAARQFARAREKLEAAGVACDVRETEYPGHATKLAARAAEDGAEIVVALGGDGTVREVASGLVGTKTPMGILPVGSGNDFARSLGIPLSLEAAAAVLREGIVRQVDAGRDEAGVFLCMAGIGFAAEVSHEAAQMRIFRGSSAYFVAVFKALMRLRAVPLRLHLDEQVLEMDAVFVMAQNTPFCGGGQKMAPCACLDDGKFDVVVVSSVGRLELIRTLPKVYSGTHITHPAFHLHRSSCVRVESEAALLKMLDGDVVGSKPLDAVVQPMALRVVVPSASSGADSSPP